MDATILVWTRQRLARALRRDGGHPQPDFRRKKARKERAWIWLGDEDLNLG